MRGISLLTIKIICLKFYLLKKKVSIYQIKNPCYLVNEIMYAIEKNDATIIVGETGSGKSTKIPQFLVKAGYCNKQGKMIGVTLPKRVSVLNIANRLAFNLNSNIG